MEPNDLALHASSNTGSGSGTGTKSRHAPKTIDRALVVWEGLRQIYGASFTTMYGTDPSTIWLDRIAELRDHEVRTGLSALSKHPAHYPCNLTEFVEACRPRSTRYLGTPTTPEAMQRALPGVSNSKWARSANVRLMKFLYGHEGRRPVCEYPADNNAPGWPKKPIDSAPLDRFLAAKREIVEAAEQSERDGDPWDRDDFYELLDQAFERAAETTMEAAA